MRAAPGLWRRVMCKLFYHTDERLEPVAIDQPLTAGETLPIAGGIEVIHTPGHCAGQVALLWRPGRMLFAGDVCANLMGLGDPVGFESVRASANMPVFHSMLPGSAMARLSPAMRRRVSAISGARNHLPDIGDACFGSNAAHHSTCQNLCARVPGMGDARFGSNAAHHSTGQNLCARVLMSSERQNRTTAHRCDRHRGRLLRPFALCRDRRQAWSGSAQPAIVGAAT
jgi:hypothetical protein